MPRKLDRYTTAFTALLVVAALLACKKKTPVPTAPSAEAVVVAPPPATTPAAPATPPAAVPADSGAKLGDVKRYTDREKAQTGTVRIVEDNVKVFNEADDKTADVAILPKNLLVFRLASIPDWELVEFPSGVGKVSPGWVPAKFVDTKSDASLARDAVGTQGKQAVVTPTGSAAAKSTASSAAAAKPAATTAASAKAAASAAAAKTAADKAAADKAAADKAAADKAAADAAAARAARIAARAAARAKAAADKAAAGN